VGGRVHGGQCWRNKAAQTISDFQVASREEGVENKVWSRRVSLENSVDDHKGKEIVVLFL